MEGRRLVGQLQNGIREVVLECYAALPQPDAEEDEEGGEKAVMRDAMALRISPPASSSFVSVATPGASASPGGGDGGAWKRVGSEEEEDEEAAALQLEAAKEVRRLANVLFAFVRQDVRESRYGFLPLSDMERVRFCPREVGLVV